jgi:hypothetical protein
VIEAFHVHPKNTVKFFFGGPFDRADVRDAGVIDKNRKTLALGELLKKRADLLAVGDIATVSGGVSAGGVNLLASGFGRFEIHIEDAERGSVGGELARDRAADPAAAAGDDGDSAIESKRTAMGRWRIQRETPRFQGMKSLWAFYSARAARSATANVGFFGRAVSKIASHSHPAPLRGLRRILANVVSHDIEGIS